MIINYILDAIILILILVMIVFTIVRLRNKTLTLWNEVSRLELTFHKKLFETVQVFLTHKKYFEHHDHGKHYQLLHKYETEMPKELALSERQEIFKALQSLYLCIDETSHPAQLTLKNQFDELQSCRLRFNSKVIYYNDFIQSFPMRLLARHMHFEPKEYFG